MQNVRYNISPCSPQEAEAFIDKVDKAVYVQRATVKADDRSHYDRYAFVRDDSKVAVVYDTSASVISITAPERFADDLLDLFGAGERTVKKSTVPAQNSARREQQKPRDVSIGVEGSTPDTRARLFVSPESIRYRPAVKAPTVIATAKGLEISTDEIFPPQRAKPRAADQEAARQVMYNKPNAFGYGRDGQHVNASSPEQKKSASFEEYFVKNQGVTPLSVQPLKNDVVLRSVIQKPARNTKISFGDDDEETGKTLPERPRSGTGVYADIAVGVKQEIPQQQPEPQKKKRGRPRKETATADIVMPPELREAPPVVLEYKNGYSVKNFPEEKLTAMLKRLKADGYTVKSEGTEFGGTSQEVKMFAVTDASGAKVYLRYATKKMTVQLQGKRSELFGEIQSQVSRDSDYSSALENYIEESADGTGKSKVSDMENKLKKRLPTAYGFLSEQSRIDFSYGLHDFSQNMLMLSDYSVLLVPPYRGLERFVFDLQRARGIKVKMIGQAFDKDNDGNYILKAGYSQRINSVVYDEVMVALYQEYFSRRNFFAHSDNSTDNRSRAIPDRNVAKGIFERLLDVVEYNAKKLKEIRFSIAPDEQ